MKTLEKITKPVANTTILSVQLIATHNHTFFGMLEHYFRTPNYTISLINDSVKISKDNHSHYYLIPRALCIIEFGE